MVNSLRFSLFSIVLTLCLLGSGWGACPEGDLDNNCRVDFNDVKFLADHWLEPVGSPADVVGEDGVNIGDFAIIAMNWLATGGPTGSLRVTIAPSGAIAAGAQWRVDGGEWRNTGDTVNNLIVGPHTVEFKDTAGWTKPDSEVVQVNEAELTSITRSYIQQTGSLRVDISPAAVVSVGAQWRVDSGLWQDSGATVDDLAAGSHIIDFKDVAGWTKPGNEAVQVSSGELTVVSRSYAMQTGSVRVTISPAEAVAAGAQWRIDGGLWQDSGATVSGLPIGSHAVEFKDAAGWTKPSNEMVEVTYGGLTDIERSYIRQVGSLQVTILPAEAITAGAQWRVDGGPWQSSGATVGGLAVGSHTVDYQDIAGWTKPGSEIVQINSGELTATSGSYVRQTGSLQVTILPAEAVAAGAKWRVDGTGWHSSGETVTGLSVGPHTVDFKDVGGWTAPGSEVVQIASGEVTSISRSYVGQSGSLTVDISPAEAITAGAQWRVDGGVWQNSGATLAGVAVGLHTVEYKDIFGWVTPAGQSVQINEDELTSTSGTYVRQTGSLRVTISPAEAVAAGAQWRVDGGAWRDSGATVTGLAVGSHSVEYKDISGWTGPGSEVVDIADGELADIGRAYARQVGSLKVDISPSEAITAGAQWRVDGGVWRDSGATVSGIAVGSHTIDYKDIAGWTTPGSEAVQINEDELTTTSGAYVRQTGSLTASILPTEAAAAGGQWRVDGGLWQDSGATVSGIAVGSHTVDYKDIAGWTAPGSEVVQINDGELTSTSGSYVRQAGSLRVDILPAEAVTAGGQWCVDGGVWRNSGATAVGLAVGSHTIDFKDVTGWTTPGSEAVQINDGELTSTSGTYVRQTGSLRIMIFPTAAVTAGGQWRVDGGLWQDSGAIVSDLAVGSHTFEFKDVAGWTKPSSEVVYINNGELTSVNRSYIEIVGSLTASILPSEAVTAGGQWRVDGSEWQNSGVTFADLAAGPHTVEYKSITGWTAPSSEVVQVNDGELTSTSGTYIRQTGSLQVSISPSEAVTAGAQWRVDGGTWQDSGATVSGLVVGSHTVEYKPTTGWTEPGSEVVQVNNGATTTANGTYVLKVGSLQVTILPSEAVTAGGQWRVDGGIWLTSGVTVNDLAVGSHTVEYRDVAGWTKPDSEVVQVNDGALTSTSGTYVRQTGSLRVTLSPAGAVTAGAQWRVDGGAWQNSGATATGLGVGAHSVEYKDIGGWTQPSSEVVDISDGALTDISRSYTQQVGSLKVDILPSGAITVGAKWRVDGGDWQNSGATVSGLAVGSHTVDYQDIAGWTRPGSEVVQINDGELTNTSGTYVQQTGSLRVTILPSGAASAGAQWRVDGGAWQNSGATVAGLPVGSHTVEFKDTAGWTKPGSEVVEISNGVLTDISRSYVQQVGSLKVDILPSEAITAGAKWRVDGGAWQNSGATVSGLAVGSHTVDYQDVAGWTKPGGEVVEINDGVLTGTSGTYVQQTGSLQVTILPSEAAAAGGQWRVDGGVWRNSGATVSGLAVGSHTVDYKGISSWTAPGSEVVQINNGATTSTSGTYILQVGSLKVDITPAAAVSAGAQWRVDGGLWLTSGVTLTDLAVGSHTIDFRDAAGWTPPDSEVIEISDGVLTHISRAYAEQAGSLRVTILPAGAVTAGAQWRVDGGVWQNSGATVGALSVGSHAVEFKDVEGWTKPSGEVVQVDDGVLTDISRSYVEQVGSLRVTISPSSAVAAGAQWRIDGGIWRDSGSVVANLPVGFYTIEFKDVAGWVTPDDTTAQIYEGELTDIGGSYIEPVGSLRVTLTPQAAVDQGAQWRVDGGIWLTSGVTVTGLASGLHNVDFRDVAGWITPASESVQVNSGELTSISRAYGGQAGSLRVDIGPAEAVAGGAQWRADGGDWHNSGETISDMPTGSHLIEFKEIAGWISARDRTAVVNEGEGTVIFGSYGQPLVINEFMASNHSPNPPIQDGQLVDEDGDSSDWIEIYNPTDITIDLSGWYLTASDSNLAKWEFPSGVEIDPGDFLIVFASNKDRRVAGSPLHTNFELDADREYLALVSRDGISVVHEYWPEYPVQLSDVSYGRSQNAIKLVAEGATVKYHVPTVSDAGLDWTARDFADSSWQTATTALSFEPPAVETGQDIGSPSAAGSHTAVGGVYTIEADGDDIWNYSDNFYYVYAPLSGDGGLTARVTSVENTNEWAKAGVMIRETLTGGSKHAMMIVTPSGKRSMQWRAETDDRSWDNTVDTGTALVPFWVRIERIGDTISGYYAPDAGGSPGTWAEQASTTITMGTNVYAGLCVTSHTAGVLCTAVVDNVTGDSAGTNALRQAMLNVNSSLWTRIEFYLEAGQADTFDTLMLQTKYEDGYVAYLNGEKVAWGNAPSAPAWNSAALSDRPIVDSETFEPNNVLAHLDALVTGKNVLAIQALNDSQSDDEFLLLPELVAASESDVYQYFIPATPGAFNAGGALGIADEVWFSHERGFYNSGFDLILSTGTSGGEIRYTTNGSRPSASNGHVYTAAIHIDETTTLRAVCTKPGYLDSEVETHTYIFVGDVITQSLSGEKPDANWPDDGLNGQKFEYGMDAGVVGDATWGPQLDEALVAIPTISIVTDLQHLFDPVTGIYVNAYNHGYDWERPTSVELIYPYNPQGPGFPDLQLLPDGLGGYSWQLPRDMQGGFQIDCGIRIRGGYSRSGGNPKHAFRLFFRSEYGAGKLDYPLFGDEGVEKFDKMDLRTAQNYSWSFENNSDNVMCREVWARDSQGLMGQPNTRSRYYHLYINGQYWGLFQTQERSEAAYAESYFGGDKDEYDVVKAVGDGDYQIEATDGTMDTWQQLWDLANLGFGANENFYRSMGLNIDGTRNYAYPVLLDAENLIDYMIMVFFDGDRDAPISWFLGNNKPNNWYGIRNRYGDEGFRFFVHDAEHSMSRGLVDRTGPYPAGDIFIYSNPQWIHQELMAHGDYRVRFSDRAFKHLLNGGLLRDENTIPRFQFRAGQIDMAIIAESARWGDLGLTKNTWINALNNEIINFFPGRADTIIGQLRNTTLRSGAPAPLYPHIDPPSLSYPGGEVSSGYSLTMSAPSGTIYYTTDGSDPRLPLGQSTPGSTVTLVSEDAEKRVLVPTGPVVATTGSIRYEYWMGIGGTAVSNLVSHPAYPDNPSGSYYLPSFEQPVDWADQYGARISGYVHPPATGNYTFWVSSDDGSELWLSTNDDPDNAVLIAYEDSWSASRDWQSGPEQSATISLVGGNRYYIEAMVKEDGGGDNLAVTWSGPGVTFGVPIDGAYLSPAGIAWTTLGYDHSGWTRHLHKEAIGYERNPGDPVNYDDLIDIDVESAMYGTNRTCYVRIPFTVSSLDMSQLTLKVRYDDGFVAYINGNRVASRNFADAVTPEWNSGAEASHDDTLAREFEEIDITGEINKLQIGSNILAIQGLNYGTTNSDFLLSVEMEAAETGQGDPSPSATAYVGSISIDDSTKVKARVFDGVWSALQEASYAVGPVKDSLRITEIMYHPGETGDPDDPNEEFIELKNVGGTSINLSWVRFTNGVDFTFGDVDLGEGQYVIVVRQLAAFMAANPGYSGLIAGEYSGKLDNAGERIVLVDAIGQIIHDFKYKDGWRSITDGDGYSLTIIDPTNGDPNTWAEKDYWRASVYTGGSPGADDSGIIPNPGAIVINEVLAHSHGVAADWIELYNTTGSTINIGGWYLSDSESEPMKYRIAPGTEIDAYDYWVFYEDTNFGDPASDPGRIVAFALSEDGEAVYLRSGEEGIVTGYRAGEDFGASQTGISFGRYFKRSTGNYNFVSMDHITPGDKNAYPKVGPVVITEMMYNPVSGDQKLEYIELYNTSSTVGATLYDSNEGLPWRFTNGIDFKFPGYPGFTMAPESYIIIAKDIGAYLAEYGFPPSGVMLLGPYEGSLSNSGEDVDLSRPGDLNELGQRNWIRVERVGYSDGYHPGGEPGDIDQWPTEPDGGGASLSRIWLDLYANDPNNWAASDPPTPGF
ncbi:MAG: lamin tail domain-containing protein [Sedimentisphaerales bacterium]|nr:lamin tail domain-containing protein [Sedimentisphaerales bacterium]